MTRPGSTQPAMPLDPEVAGSIAEGYRRRGDEYFASGEYLKALEYLGKSHSVDRTNQATLVKAGVALAKIGKGAVARKVLKKAVELDPASAEADQARIWLHRMDTPVKVTVLPDENQTRAARVIPTQEFIGKILADSALYKVVDYQSLGLESHLSDLKEACRVAISRDVRVILKPATAYKVTKSSSADQITVSCAVTVGLYQTRTGSLLRTVHQAGSWQMSQSLARTALPKKLSELFHKLLMEISSTLM